MSSQIDRGDPDVEQRPDGAVKPTLVPDLMKIGAVPTNTQMDVETDILEPVVQSETFCRFRLQNKGILHSNSKLTFSVVGGLTGTDNAFFPLNVGVHSLIERCVLKSGTKTLCETDGFNQFMAYRSCFINPQHNKQREAFTTGRMMCRQWVYNNGTYTNSYDGNAVGSMSDYNANGYTLDTGVEIQRLNLAPAAHELRLPNQCLVTEEGVDRSPVYQISLNDLFPFLKMNQLPLYMVKEELDVELHYAPANNRICVSEADGITASLDFTETKFIADYIYYPQEMMDAYAEANRKLSFTYVDYRRVRHTVTSDNANANTIILNLGGAGRIVNKVFFCLTSDKTDPANPVIQPERTLLNIFTADSVQPNFGGPAALRSFGSVTHNLKYNDKQLYPIDVTNTARMFDNIAQAEGSTPFISKDEYSNNLSLITSQLVEQQDLRSQIWGMSFWTCDRLNTNERVNSRGIELYQTWDFLKLERNYTLNCWLELVRFATLEDGAFSVSWA